MCAQHREKKKTFVLHHRKKVSSFSNGENLSTQNYFVAIFFFINRFVKFTYINKLYSTNHDCLSAALKFAIRLLVAPDIQPVT